MISIPDKSSFVTAGAISPGTSKIQSPYRSKLLGMLGLLEELYNICLDRNVTRGKCTIYCDGLSALQMVEKLNRDSLSTRHLSCSLLSACVAHKELIPVQLQFTHVKGHQDDNVNIDELSVPAQINVLMDGLAKDLLMNLHNYEDPERFLGHELGYTLPECGVVIREQFKSTLYESIMTKKGHAYWIQKERYDKDSIDCIDWLVQESAFNSEKTTRQRNLSKWISGWIASGKNMKRWNKRYKGDCPFCGHENEDNIHILHCSHDVPTQSWKTLLSEYDVRLAKLKTCYALRKAIILDLRAWRNNKRYPPTSNMDDLLRSAIEEQRRIGWKTYLEGLITTKIFNYQQDYMAHSYPDKKPNTWAKKVIKAGWRILMEMWEKRNNKLHEPDVLQEMEGKKVLNKVVAKEWDVGLSNLPAFEFSHLFRLKLDKLMKKSIEGKKDWLVTVKMTRRLYEDRNIMEDEFETNEALQEWIGLP